MSEVMLSPYSSPALVLGPSFATKSTETLELLKWRGLLGLSALNLKVGYIVLGVVCISLGGILGIGVFDECINPATKLPECTGPVLPLLAGGGLLLLYGLGLLVLGLISKPRPPVGYPRQSPPLRPL